MKWIALLLWASLCPILLAHLRRRPEHLHWAAFAMGLGPFLAGGYLDAAPIAWPGWRGWPKGLELSMIDFLAVAVIGATPGKLARLSRLWPWLAYLAAVVVAIPQAGAKMAAFFYVWQLMRAILVAYAAMRLAAALPRASEFLFKGIFAGICIQVFFSLSQAAAGIGQASGAFGAQNLLGMMTHFALFPAFAMLLAGRRGAWPVVGFLSSVVVDLLTASRATLGLAAIGLGMLGAASLFKSFSSRKIAVVAMGALLAAAATPYALYAIKEKRGANTVESSDFQRAAMKEAAWWVIQDHPFGVGPNQYVVVSNVGGYSARAGVAWNEGSRGTSVHDSYLLVWAETGLAGLITMLLLLASPILVAGRASLRYRREPESEILLGIAVAGIILAAHLLYEWLFILAPFQYVFAMMSGLAVGVSANLAAKRKAALRARSVRAPAEVEAPAFSTAR